MAWSAPSAKQACAFRVAASRGQHARAQGLGHLDGRDTNAAAAALHQRCFTRLAERPRSNTLLQHGEEGLGQRSRLDVTQPCWHRQALPTGATQYSA